MSRKILLLFVSICLSGIYSCNDWLDVEPDDEMLEEKLFSSGEGFRTALNGVYKQMASQELYGMHFTWGLLDAMGQYYDPYKIEEGVFSFATTFTFDHYDVKPYVETFWEMGYNTVANCNNILNKVEKADPDIFYLGEQERQLIWGEALALRAFIQLDLVRFFAPSPAMGTTEKVMPYKKEYPSRVSPKLTVAECLGHIIKDLSDAKEKLREYDSELDMSVTPRFKSGSGERRFLVSRGYRMNYHAISALLARAYMHAGMHGEAYAEAKTLLEMQEETGYFGFPRKYNVETEKNIKMINDIICGLYVAKLTEWDAETYKDGGSMGTYYLAMQNLDSYFDDDERATDYRYRFQLEELKDDYGWESDYLLRKNSTPSVLNDYTRTGAIVVPLVRMSEIYYIA
ncbi:RagB/SusD family nutrient uptake outer membrane protein, partial [Alistipes sp. OttesenSCG-928-B03]|nr:RagB/SusD family nutrient uptake outer membrane protein [Alistipes sp. OttesenSCG-928-B03]